jgi:hypothetical protein
MSTRNEARAARDKRIAWAERLRVARELIGSVWREADSPITQEPKLRQIENDIRFCERTILDGDKGEG